MPEFQRIGWALVWLTLATAVPAQDLYKFRGENGEWVFSDRKPDASIEPEVRELSRGDSKPAVRVFYQTIDGDIRLFASNDFYAPVQVVLEIEQLIDVQLPPADQDLQFVVAPRDETFLMQFVPLEGSVQPRVAYRFAYVLGDPEARHAPEQPYRAPFAVANSYPISQAYPFAITHTTPDAYHAVDIVMPIGTDVYAARGGVVIDVASTNYRNGLDPTLNGADANQVRILHADGTYAVYAHLNWNTIRVKPGDEVSRGEYIADSGNTGFSTGPHLHFAVIRNADTQSEAVPVLFEGVNKAAIVPELGNTLVAY